MNINRMQEVNLFLHFFFSPAQGKINVNSPLLIFVTEIILASASRRRKELLQQLVGDNFAICVSSYDEQHIDGLKAAGLVMHHSEQKARSVAVSHHGKVIIAADTVILCDNEILGKPESRENARQMLENISGCRISTITGITVLDTVSGNQITEYEETRLWIRDLSASFIDAYISTAEPCGKAGAFAIQGKGALIVERIEGDYFNVLGLPLYRLSRILEKLNLDLLYLFFDNKL